MALRRLLETTATASALAFAVLAMPALAQAGAVPVAPPTVDSPMPPPPPVMHAGHGGGYAPPAELRSSWLAECYDRMRDNGVRRKKAAERCERIFDSHYAYYRSAQPSMTYGYGPAYGYGYAAPAYALAPANGGCVPCGAPMAAGPVPAPAVRRGEPVCTETVEYEYIDVPVRAAPRRAAPPRRAVPSKRVPDKRIKLN
jgi:hypothetical protein